MGKKTWLIMISIGLFLGTVSAWANDLTPIMGENSDTLETQWTGYANSPEEIVDGLRPPHRVRTRSLRSNRVSTSRSRGLGSVENDSEGEHALGKKTSVQTRTVVVIKAMPDGGTQKTTVTEPLDYNPVKLRIEFDVNSAVIRPESYQLLANLSQALTSDSIADQVVLIKGHTDSDGTADHNHILSLRRAEAVRGYLAGQYQIVSERLLVRGYGEELPLFPNTSSTNKQHNRRVEVELVQ